MLSEKADLGIRIKTAYNAKDHGALDTICQDVIPRIMATLQEMKLLREQLWFGDAKPFGYEFLDIKLGGVITRLDSHCRRIRSYLDGKVSSLIELEQERMPYFPTDISVNHGRDICLRENRWNKIVSGCDLVDTI